jgi:DNA-binding GntR family transcriptional regulator
MPEALSPIAARFHAAAPSTPKHLRLREAIIGAVEAGELEVGAKLAGERELSETLGLSLGTTQKALGALMGEGFLVRRQGHGTFVGRVRKSVTGSWHYRFTPPGGGEELPVYIAILERRIETAEGLWSEALGPDPKGYVVIRRRADIGEGAFHCANSMYLPASRFARLLRMAEKRLADTNLKEVLSADFGAPTLQSDGLAYLRPAGKDDARVMGIAAATPCMHVHITGRSVGRVPITFQLMVVPPTAYGLKLDFNPPGGR